jgi:carboxylesterase type B
VSQPLETLQALKYHNLPVLLGSNTHEGNMFVYGAYSAVMTKVVFQAVLYGFFREMTSKVLQTYAGLTAQIAKSPSGDYRAVLSQIIGDYLFRCPTQQFADQLHELGYSVYLYEFALPTKVPNFPFCDGLSCHTCEIPFVFANTKLIEDFFSWDNSISNFIFESREVMFNEHAKSLDSKIGRISWLEKFAQSFFGSKSIYAAREAILKGPSVNEHVVDLMSYFWISFADAGTPSHGSEWWPPLKTTQLSTMGKFISNRIQINNQGIVKNKIPIQVKKQLMHQMQFGTKSKVVLIENDCICDFWRSVNYRF